MKKAVDAGGKIAHNGATILTREGEGSGTYDIARAKQSAFGIVHGQRQLLDVYTERLDRLRLYRTSEWDFEKSEEFVSTFS